MSGARPSSANPLQGPNSAFPKNEWCKMLIVSSAQSQRSKTITNTNSRLIIRQRRPLSPGGGRCHFRAAGGGPVPAVARRHQAGVAWPEASDTDTWQSKICRSVTRRQTSSSRCPAHKSHSILLLFADVKESKSHERWRKMQQPAAAHKSMF